MHIHVFLYVGSSLHRALPSMLLVYTLQYIYTVEREVLVYIMRTSYFDDPFRKEMIYAEKLRGKCTGACDSMLLCVHDEVLVYLIFRRL